VFAVPLPLVPMAPTLARAPFRRDGWVFEEKADGWIAVAVNETTSAAAPDRDPLNGRSVAACFPISHLSFR
jgi:hypothetical protein